VAYSPAPRVFAYALGRDAATSLHLVACMTGGVWRAVTESGDLAAAAVGYNEALTTVLRASQNVSWTAPYLDASGLGLVTTASTPVTNPVTGEFEGVVGLDVPLGALLSGAACLCSSCGVCATR
jgi:hypothetical protein